MNESTPDPKAEGSASDDSTNVTPKLPRPPVERLLSPARQFMQIESASGIILLAVTVIALVLANTAAADWYKSVWKTPVLLEIGSLVIKGDLGHLIVNDGLMVIFFFVVGLEIKREIIMGELREFRKAMLPVVAAVGGMVVPALIYAAMQMGQPGLRGWAIPMATDIAFVVGFLALFGPRIPFSLKIMLLTLAIADDLGAVLVIAVVYTDTLAWDWIGIAALGFGIVLMMNAIGVRAVSVYFVVGIGIWLAIYKSGVHATVAGVLLGLITPARAWIGDETLLKMLTSLRSSVEKSNTDVQSVQKDLRQFQFVAREVVSPLQRLENMLHPWMAFGIMPLFALANAGVKLDVGQLANPVAIAVAMGLALGKPIGILLACWLAVRYRLSDLPAGVSWPMMAGAACLGGIGFTMSLFINSLAFTGAEFQSSLVAGKIGTMTGSLISAILATIIFLVVLWRKKRVKSSDMN